jgi:hypothetical protein
MAQCANESGAGSRLNVSSSAGPPIVKPTRYFRIPTAFVVSHLRDARGWASLATQLTPLQPTEAN